jgi:hypothetical protein
MVNPARWSWRVKFLLAVAIVEPFASTFEEPANRLLFILAWLAVALAYGALAWRARAEPGSDWRFDVFIAVCFVVAPLIGMFMFGEASRGGGRLSAVALGALLGSEWRARRQAREAVRE